MNYILFLYSCIEYDLKEAETEPVSVIEEDSAIVEPAPPPDCIVEKQTIQSIEVDQSCETEEYNIADPWNVEIQWQWQGLIDEPYIDQVMVAPIVGNLTDDDGDGLVTELDTPDIVIVAFDSRDGQAGDRRDYRPQAEGVARRDPRALGRGIRKNASCPGAGRTGS